MKTKRAKSAVLSKDNATPNNPISIVIGPMDEPFDGQVSFRELPSILREVEAFALLGKMTPSHAARCLLRIGISAAKTCQHEGVLR